MKRYLFPAFLALALHGLALAVHLPIQQAKPPRLPGIPVEIAIRHPAAKQAVTEKETAPKPVATPSPAILRPPKERVKPVPRPRPPKPAISKKVTAIKSTSLAAQEKGSKIEKQREEAQHSRPLALPPPVTAPAEEPAEAEESAAATPAAPAPQVRRQLAVPAYQRNRQPQYPPLARRRGYSGTVILKVLVGAQGQVADLAVEHTSGHRVLDQAAVDAVRQWLFSPATEDGVPVAMWVSVPITFRLEDQ